MSHYSFSFALADATRDLMASITNDLHYMLEQLSTDVNATLADWTSDAKDQYTTAKINWDAAAKRMPAELGRAEQALQEISDGYLHVEHYGVDLWSL